MPLVECPRCNEADERPFGHNVCGLCECRFWVRPGRKPFVPENEKRITEEAAPSAE